jgi:hypothetical protein
MDIAVGRDLADEADPTGGYGERFGGNQKPLRKLPQFALSAVLGRGQPAQALLNMLGVDRFFQPLEFALQRAQLLVVALKQAWLEPAIESLDTSLALGASGWDEYWLDAKPQAQAQDP